MAGISLDNVTSDESGIKSSTASMTPIDSGDATSAGQKFQDQSAQTEEPSSREEGQDQSTQTEALQSMADQNKIFNEAARQELDEFKKAIEIKAEERLREQLEQHNKTNRENLEKARGNYTAFLGKSLHMIELQEGDLHDRRTTVHLPTKLAAELLRHNSELQKEYQDLMAQELQVHQAVLKKQYRERLDEVEIECREWLEKYTSSDMNFDARDGITKTIRHAHSYEARMPDIRGRVQTIIEPKEMEAAKKENENQFWEQAQKEIQDGGLTFKREDVELEPLFEGIPEYSAGQNTAMVGVPAALLPFYPKQGSATLTIIDRNNASGLNRLTAPTSSSHGNSTQPQESPSQHFSTRSFTPINKPYLSPYAAQPDPSSSKPGPTLVPSSTWYSPTDRLAVNHVRATSTGDNAFSTQNHGSSSQKTGHPLVETFTCSQPRPRRIAPIFVGPVRQVDQSSDNEDYVPPPASTPQRSPQQHSRPDRGIIEAEQSLNQSRRNSDAYAQLPPSSLSVTDSSSDMSDDEYTDADDNGDPRPFQSPDQARSPHYRLGAEDLAGRDNGSGYAYANEGSILSEREIAAFEIEFKGKTVRQVLLKLRVRGEEKRKMSLDAEGGEGGGDSDRGAREMLTLRDRGEENRKRSPDAEGGQGGEDSDRGAREMLTLRDRGEGKRKRSLDAEGGKGGGGAREMLTLRVRGEGKRKRSLNAEGGEGGGDSDRDARETKRVWRGEKMVEL